MKKLFLVFAVALFTANFYSCTDTELTDDIETAEAQATDPGDSTNPNTPPPPPPDNGED